MKGLFIFGKTKKVSYGIKRLLETHTHTERERESNILGYPSKFLCLNFSNRVPKYTGQINPDPEKKIIQCTMVGSIFLVYLCHSTIEDVIMMITKTTSKGMFSLQLMISQNLKKKKKNKAKCSMFRERAQYLPNSHESVTHTHTHTHSLTYTVTHPLSFTLTFIPMYH